MLVTSNELWGKKEAQGRDGVHIGIQLQIDALLIELSIPWAAATMKQAAAYITTLEDLVLGMTSEQAEKALAETVAGPLSSERIDALVRLVTKPRHTDSTGRPIGVGDRVRWRGEEYVIKGFLPGNGIEFDRPLHLGDMPDEISVDLV